MDYFSQMLSSLKELIRIPSVKAPKEEGAPYGKDIKRALDYMLALGEKMGFTVKNVDDRACHIEWGEGEELFGILAHLDVVPAGDGWVHEPFGAEEEDGYIYGRGMQDDKGPAVAVLYAMYELKEQGFKPNKRVRLILGCDEESGWSCIDHYFSKEEMPTSGFSPDGDFPIINSEKGVAHFRITYPYQNGDNGFILKELSAGQRVNMVPDKASCVYELGGREHTLFFEGKSAHGSTPECGINAAFPLVNRMAELSDSPVFREISELFVENANGEKLGLNITDDSGSLTLNLGTLSYDGSSVCVEIDIRHPFSISRDELIERLTAQISGKISPLGSHRPLFVPEDSPLVVTLKEAYQSVTGEEAFCIAIGGATYARALDNAVAFGPIFPDSESTIHMKEERMLVSELHTMYEIYKKALSLLFGA